MNANQINYFTTTSNPTKYFSMNFNPTDYITMNSLTPTCICNPPVTELFATLDPEFPLCTTATNLHFFNNSRCVHTKSFGSTGTLVLNSSWVMVHSSLPSTSQSLESIAVLGNSSTTHLIQWDTCALFQCRGSVGMLRRSCSRLKLEHTTHRVTVSCWFCDDDVVDEDVDDERFFLFVGGLVFSGDDDVSSDSDRDDLKYRT